MGKELAEHDRLFKELLRVFFLEFLDLFLPEVAAYVQRDSMAFLDKEVFTDVTAGERHEVDLLVRAVSTRGRRRVLPDPRREPGVGPVATSPRRLFHYFARLHEQNSACRSTPS